MNLKAAYPVPLLEIKTFWSSVLHYISQITSLSFSSSVLDYIYPLHRALNKKERMIDLCLLQARRSIALGWSLFKRNTHILSLLLTGHKHKSANIL